MLANIAQLCWVSSGFIKSCKKVQTIYSLVAKKFLNMFKFSLKEFTFPQAVASVCKTVVSLPNSCNVAFKSSFWYANAIDHCMIRMVPLNKIEPRDKLMLLPGFFPSSSFFLFCCTIAAAAARQSNSSRAQPPSHTPVESGGTTWTPLFWEKDNYTPYLRYWLPLAVTKKHLLFRVFSGNLPETIAPKYSPFPRKWEYACGPLNKRSSRGRRVLLATAH